MWPVCVPALTRPSRLSDVPLSGVFFAIQFMILSTPSLAKYQTVRAFLHRYRDTGVLSYRIVTSKYTEKRASGLISLNSFPLIVYKSMEWCTLSTNRHWTIHSPVSNMNHWIKSYIQKLMSLVLFVYLSSRVSPCLMALLSADPKTGYDE